LRRDNDTVEVEKPSEAEFMDAEEECVGSPEIFIDEDFEESPKETMEENISEKKEPVF
jgi:hypothetical protein